MNKHQNITKHRNFIEQLNNKESFLNVKNYISRTTTTNLMVFKIDVVNSVEKGCQVTNCHRRTIIRFDCNRTLMCKIDCQKLLILLNLQAPEHPLHRRADILHIPVSRTNYVCNEAFNNSARRLNDVVHYFDFTHVLEPPSGSGFYSTRHDICFFLFLIFYFLFDFFAITLQGHICQHFFVVMKDHLKNTDCFALSTV